MTLGPYDSRANRSRCSACSTSHLKCSGLDPCSNCARQRIVCAYTTQNAAQRLILVERGRHKTAASWPRNEAQTHHTSRDASQALRKSYSTPPGCLADQAAVYMSFFATFTRVNNFTGRPRTTGDEVKQLAELHSRKGSHLFNAILAVGAMYAAKLNQNGPSKREALLVAFQHYSYSVAGLREAIDAVDFSQGPRLRRAKNQHVCILWTTFFLGLFELMNEATGHGWQQHIIHGTSKALKSTGPGVCRSGPGLAFFIQARIFEISRTILFNEPTFLTEPEWVALSRDVWTGEESCASASASAAEAFIQGRMTHPQDTLMHDAKSLSEDGHLLREALTTWSAAYIPDTTRLSVSLPSGLTEGQGCNKHDVAANPSTLLARVFYAAISIYLSGVFDYELSHWQQLNLSVPTLDQGTVAQHVDTILTLTSTALSHTSLSPVLFLFPLRIAGARSYYQLQRDRVAALVGQIGNAFAVASAIRSDLSRVWQVRAVLPHSDNNISQKESRSLFMGV
ncbi:C6 finger domain protein [Metarhizium rileyi]|uniref:C6 finger domain protein n=1 Tax=Metarhizium rileyi (strain RCEF 4871) TaxID=1649241 RepID=A0A166S8D1_METRR|nr:C6 finger domain protein [Metarhizium rileyi RCEF 4871]